MCGRTAWYEKSYLRVYMFCFNKPTHKCFQLATLSSTLHPAQLGRALRYRRRAPPSGGDGAAGCSGTQPTCRRAASASCSASETSCSSPDAVEWCEPRWLDAPGDRQYFGGYNLAPTSYMYEVTQPTPPDTGLFSHVKMIIDNDYHKRRKLLVLY